MYELIFTMARLSMKQKPYHHGDLRSALIDAAARLVRREGAAQVSLRGIAREAGVSHAAPYHHFDDRESLLAEVALVGFEGLGATLREGARSNAAPDPLTRLQGAGVAYVEFAVENPEIYRLMFGGLLSDRKRYPALQAAANAAFGVLLELLGGGGESDESTSVNPVALATWSTVHGLGSLMLEGLLVEEAETMGTSEIARQVTMVLGRGLRSYADSGVAPRDREEPKGGG